MYILNGQEVNCLKTIAKRVRYHYFYENKYIFVEEEIESKDESLFVSADNVEINIEIKMDRELCAQNLEKIFGDEIMQKIVKALTLKEKLMLSLYYSECKTDNEIAKLFDMNTKAISRKRQRLLKRMNSKYNKIKEKGNEENV